jgi:ABC-type dipeptide/oligopeptide/nickel transport system permease subunit
MQSEDKSVLPDYSQKSRSYWGLSVKRLLRNKLAVACLVIIFLMYGSGILASWVTPYGYNDQNLNVSASTTSRGCRACEGPSLAHLFGTDRLGRDQFTRVIYGLRTTVIVTVTALMTGSLVLGISLGLIAGYFGRSIDSFIMRLGEVTSSFPDIFLVLIIAATVKPRITNWVRDFGDIGVDIVRLGIVDYIVIAGALAIFSWFGMARLVRGQVFQVRENQYVEAARALGASTPRILVSHILPNILSPVIVAISAILPAFIGAELFLSWMGAGIQPPTPSLGLMIFENGSISVLQANPHLLLFPVGAVAILLFTFSLLGDAINDAFNPRTH